MEPLMAPVLGSPAAVEQPLGRGEDLGKAIRL